MAMNLRSRASERASSGASHAVLVWRFRSAIARADTLVIDNRGGQKSGRFAMVDMYGTPHSPALHVVERYRLVDYEDAKDGLGA